MNREQKNTLLPYSLDTPVNKLFPNVFERPVLFVYPDTKLVELTSYLAMGPQIYADGLLVMERPEDEKQDNDQVKPRTASRRVIGQLGSKHIISHITQTDSRSYQNLFHTKTALDIMDNVSYDEIIEPSSPVSRVIEMFEKKRFALVPIVSKITTPIENSSNTRTNVDNISHENYDGKMMTATGVISVRDFLPLFVKSVERINEVTHSASTEQEITFPISEISSKLISVNKSDSLKDTIDLMIKNSTRNIGIKDMNSNPIGILNDRSILEFLFSHKDFVMEALYDKIDDYIEDGKGKIGTNSTQTRVEREVVDNRYYTKDNSNTETPRSINSIINDLHIIPLSKLKVMKTTTLSRAAELLADLRTPCLVLEEEDEIVTPWDVIVKTAHLNK